MQQVRQLVFKPFRLDPADACVWRGAQRLSLTPKAFMVLQHLVMHHSQLVTKDALLAAIWPDAVVGDAVLKVCIRELRRALGDAAKTPKFIATVYRQGYRFIRRVTAVAPPPPPSSANHSLLAASENPRHPPNPSYTVPHLVGRDEVLTHLHTRLEQVSLSKRQLVFVTGEAGIGKTAVVETFAAQARTTADIWTTRVECIEQYGAREAYLPILEAIGRLCREPGGERLTDLLWHQAPNWLNQMPWLIEAQDHDTLKHRLLHSTRDCMLLEIAEVIEALTADLPLVLILEDLQWSDYATLDLISFLARRQEPAQLLMIGTYRPVEVIVNNHPLKAVKQTLKMQRCCVEIPLELLSASEVVAHLEGYFQESHLPESLVQLIYQRTDGNPLFLVNMVEYLLAQRLLGLHNGHWTLQAEINEIEAGVPDSLRQLAEQQLDQLSGDEQHILEAASVLGMDFSATSVAAVLEKEIVEIEEGCDLLARQYHILHSAGVVEWPDGTVTARYAFRHWLYQHVSYRRIGVTQRIRLHQRVGRHLEAGYPHIAGQIAAELAGHFAQGREIHRAVLYLQHAADNAARRFAHREAIDYLTQTLALIERLPPAEQTNHYITSLKQRGAMRRAIGDRSGAEEDAAILAQYETHPISFHQQSLFA